MTSALSTVSWTDTAMRWMRLWWWVIAIAVAVMVIYERGFALLQQEKHLLSSRRSSLNSKKAIALEQQRILREEIASHDDPAWVEMTLMKTLGVVPAGYQKIYFLRD